MKKIYINIAFFIGCIGIVGLGNSCTGSFERINENPNTVPYYMMSRDNLLTGSAISQMENYGITTDANQYQRMFNLAGDVFAGYIGATGTWNNNSNNTTYALYPEWYNVAFEVGYGKIMSAWRVLDQVKADDSTSFALAQILKVYGMHKITDMYGPIPYTKFGQSELVPYDAQSEIYDAFFVELTDAVNVLYEYTQLYPGAAPLKAYDLIYAGDFNKWIKFANTLKLRLAMRTVYADAAKAQQYAEEAVNHPLGVLLLNADNAYYPVPQRNPLNEIWSAYGEACMGATMACYMNGYNDPRRTAYFTPQAYAGGVFYGVRNGIEMTSARKTVYNLLCAVPNVAPSDPLQWMVAAEAYFLRAEGAMRGWNMGATATDLYNLGIQTSFEQHGASGSDTYLADNASMPSIYMDMSGAYNYVYSPANTLTIAWNDAAPEEEKLERIITQKYLALFPDGQEAWSEFRRTGYPKVIPVALNRSNNVINTETQIRRLVFPTTEYANNNAEVNKAVELIGGVDNGSVKLWWDKK